jgi:hypothetical protein
MNTRIGPLQAQKIETKKNTSLTMNNATPRLRPFCTANVWLPSSVPSATTSRNHRIIALTVVMNPIATRVPPLAKPLKYIAAAIVKISSAKDVSKGHGDGVTKWTYQTILTIVCKDHIIKL